VWASLHPWIIATLTISHCRWRCRCGDSIMTQARTSVLAVTHTSFIRGTLRHLFGTSLFDTHVEDDVAVHTIILACPDTPGPLNPAHIRSFYIGPETHHLLLECPYEALRGGFARGRAVLALLTDFMVKTASSPAMTREQLSASLEGRGVEHEAVVGNAPQEDYKP
jgi:hypothetical protein